MEILIWLVTWLAFSTIAGVIAHQKGRSGRGFFLLAVVLSPLIGIVAALVAAPNMKQVEDRQIATGAHKKCPHCAEIIKKEARVCRYCSQNLSTPNISQEVLVHSSEKEMAENHPSLTVEACCALLAKHGYKAIQTKDDQWEITSPVNSVKRYANSIQQLREITQKLAPQRINESVA